MRHRVIDVAAVGLLALFLATVAPLASQRTFLRLGWALRAAGEPPAAARLRQFGPAYVVAVERMRRRITAGEPYVLLEARGAEPGAVFGVRFDLLPRRAVKIEGLQDLSDPARTADCIQGQLRWLVVVFGHARPPLLFALPPRLPAGCRPAPWSGPGMAPHRLSGSSGSSFSSFSSWPPRGARS
ncbi:MAG TPA: hypothetical protein VHQ90_05830 [Thermoanaerobaculia bacterium]|nr:hypothetical protein [Thermoanaerobaculia bacterium]